MVGASAAIYAATAGSSGKQLDSSSGGPNTSTGPGSGSTDSGSSDSADTGSSATSVDFSSAAASSRSGVLRVVSDSCSTGRSGTGFQIAPNLVVTVSSLLTDTISVAVTSADHQVRFGQVIGFNDDLAVIQLEHSLPGHIFGNRSDAKAGQPVGVLGFVPQSSGAAVRSATLGSADQDRHPLQAADQLQPGDLGGPVIDQQGELVGILISTDSATMLDANAAAAAATPWISSPQHFDPSSCSTASGPDEDVQPGVPDSSASTIAISDTVARYFSAIDKADYSTSYALLGPAVQSAIGTLDQFSSGQATTFDHNVTLHSVSQGSDNSLQAWVTFSSLQAGDHGPQDGQTCSNWSLDYTMMPSDDGYLINGVGAHSGSSPSTGCE